MLDFFVGSHYDFDGSSKLRHADGMRNLANLMDRIRSRIASCVQKLSMRRGALTLMMSVGARMPCLQSSMTWTIDFVNSSVIGGCKTQKVTRMASRTSHAHLDQCQFMAELYRA